MLNPGQKGWLREYLDYRGSAIDQTGGEEPNVKSRHPDESLYSILQPTGLMYGHPQGLKGIDESDMDALEKEDLIKVLLAESLINSSLLYQQKEIKNADDFSKIIIKTVSSINNFYRKVYPELATSDTNFLGKKKSPLDVAEKILEKRISDKRKFQNNFWTRFFYNSLLFLDIYFFGQWIHTNSEVAITEFFKVEKEELRFFVVKVIVAAAHANNIIEDEERTLFGFFLESAGLPSAKRKEAMEHLESGVKFEDISLPDDSWILRKYFLELAILTVWADKKVEDSEVEFLDAFCKHLGLEDEDLENSMIAIEGFVIEYWEELGQLQHKHDLQQVSERYLERISKVINRNKQKIGAEIKASKKVSTLLEQAKDRELPEEDKEVLRLELLAILKTIPTFVIIALPGRFLSLPILLKILPKSVFPFSEERANS